jgi:hypothetical protein
MLSFAGHKLGRGWVFGLNEAFDQAGATLGPLVISVVLFRHGSYRTGFALLLVSALLTIAIVFVASNLFPNPRELEAGHGLETKGFSRSYWLYLVVGAFVAAGFAGLGDGRSPREIDSDPRHLLSRVAIAFAASFRPRKTRRLSRAASTISLQFSLLS